MLAPLRREKGCCPYGASAIPLRPEGRSPSRLLVALISLVLLATSSGAQQPPSCEDQLAEALTTLSFVRASRQTTEETAGRVTATLQKRLDASLKEAEKLQQHRVPDIPESPKEVLPPQKDDAS